ncbi:MAG: thioredoxin domain-containing protein, partial [Deltaproteobacteria bacterium]|nr:thioredoxin domain-containing protein [Deltaproteobacteria bacterium]
MSDSSSAAPGANRLARETSAYLRQHRDNPVDWYPWGNEALTRAREADKPLLVSIGYSACHWCHVMAHESFEDAETAALMNRLFVSVKVDREERPDIDQIYMDTVVRFTGQGGWPLTVFCMPDGRPFYGGTYFPPRQVQGRASFSDVLLAAERAYRERRDQVEDSAEQLLRSLDPRPAAAESGEQPDAPGIASVTRAAELIMQNADHRHGGFGDAPKFPTPTNLELLLCALDFLPPDDATSVLEHCVLSCREMSRRGLYDHLAGGFHRYCVDGHWGIPHFEKMLYDQGLLIRLYAEVWRRTRGADDLAWPIRETAAYLRREMRGAEGAFYASQDADAEGIEGKYHVWTPEQVREVLGDATEAFCEAYGVTRDGNFEDGTTQLQDRADFDRSKFAAERARLLAARERRIPPGTDTKRVASWNGYAIAGLARAGSLLGDEEMIADAA